MPPRKFRIVPPEAAEEGKDPILEFIRKAGSIYSYGVLPDSTEEESPEEVHAEMVRVFLAVALKVAPDGAGRGQRVSHKLLQAATGLKIRPGDLTYGKAATRTYRTAFIGLLAHLRGIKDMIADLERLCWIGAQMSHDPRIANAERVRKGGGRRNKYRRRQYLRDGKAPPINVYLPQRLISLRDPRSKDSRKPEIE